MNENCGCCEGTEKLTPVSIANRPGLSALAYRTGAHGSFLETMKARLSTLGITHADIGLPLNKPDEQDTPNYPLQGLTTRSADDPAIAMLDAWATVADVLTFYQERIANEGYVRTATERRSLLELGRLVGYELRPGVAASTYLAYTIDPAAVAQIPAGSKAQSIPGPDEPPQTFETSEDFEARGAWNGLVPRAGRPQQITLGGILTLGELWIDGTSANLRPGDALLFVFSETIANVTSDVYALRRVQEVHPDFVQSRTRVLLQAVDSFATDAFKAASDAIKKGTVAAAPAKLKTLTFVEVRQAVLLGTRQSAFAGYGTGDATVDDLLHPVFILFPFLFFNLQYLSFLNVFAQLNLPKASLPASACDVGASSGQAF